MRLFYAITGGDASEGSSGVDTQSGQLPSLSGAPWLGERRVQREGHIQSPAPWDSVGEARLRQAVAEGRDDRGRLVGHPFHVDVKRVGRIDLHQFPPDLA